MVCPRCQILLKRDCTIFLPTYDYPLNCLSLQIVLRYVYSRLLPAHLSTPILRLPIIPQINHLLQSHKQYAYTHHPNHHILLSPLKWQTICPNYRVPVINRLIALDPHCSTDISLSDTDKSITTNYHIRDGISMQRRPQRLRAPSTPFSYLRMCATGDDWEYEVVYLCGDDVNPRFFVRSESQPKKITTANAIKPPTHAGELASMLSKPSAVAMMDVYVLRDSRLRERRRWGRSAPAAIVLESFIDKRERDVEVLGVFVWLWSSTSMRHVSG